MSEINFIVRWGHLLSGITWIGMLYSPRPNSRQTLYGGFAGGQCTHFSLASIYFQH